MKLRVIIIILVVSVIAMLISFFIPAKNITINNKIYVKTNITSANRYISDENKWKKWWPGNELQLSKTSSNKSFIYKTTGYRLSKTMYNAVNININYEGKTYNGLLIILPISKDSILLDWKTEISGPDNVFIKIRRSNLAKIIESNTTEILNAMKVFLEDSRNVYQIPIVQKMVTDTILISTKFSSGAYPSNSIIYLNVENLQHYIAQNNAEQTNPPMLHVKEENRLYHTMIALPINKNIPESKKCIIKKMVPGKILVAEVQGGINSTRHAVEQLEMFIVDYKMSSPAIPFESLITNRVLERDSSKWITKIYYPIY